MMNSAVFSTTFLSVHKYQYSSRSPKAINSSLLNGYFFFHWKKTFLLLLLAFFLEKEKHCSYIPTSIVTKLSVSGCCSFHCGWPVVHSRLVRGGGSHGRPPAVDKENCNFLCCCVWLGGVGSMVSEYPFSGCLVVSGFLNQTCFGMHLVEFLVGFVERVIGIFCVFSWTF